MYSLSLSSSSVFTKRATAATGASSVSGRGWPPRTGMLAWKIANTTATTTTYYYYCYYYYLYYYCYYYY